jgi:hypothetical protein
MLIHNASERTAISGSATGNFLLAQRGPTAERAFRRTELFIPEQPDILLQQRHPSVREFHALRVKFSRNYRRTVVPPVSIFILFPVRNIRNRQDACPTHFDFARRIL